MADWTTAAAVYHIYPLGLLDAPRTLDPAAAPVSRLSGLTAWTAHIRDLGCDTIYLGPVFRASTHGYDTIDYRQVDPRLGTNDDLKHLVHHWHQHGIRVVLDTVFNHVGRAHPWFADVQQHGEGSTHRDWFANLRFGETNPLGDPFTYEGWAGHLDLAKLNLQHPALREELFDIVRWWFTEYGIDGLRLDAADVMDKYFLRDLAAVARQTNPDCWLLGEVVHGNYAEWIGPAMLDSVTNYEAFKGLYSSFNDRNLHEIAHSLTREFGPDGVYRDLRLYSFADNHDVDRVASLLRDDRDLPLLYTLLFAMPGIPSIYYGSEWGYRGRKRGGDDGPLRPALAWPVPEDEMPHPELQDLIARLAHLRREHPALQHLDYQELHVASEQLAFLRGTADQPVIVVINSAADPVTLELETPVTEDTRLVDAVGSATESAVTNGRLSLSNLPPKSALILHPPTDA